MLWVLVNAIQMGTYNKCLYKEEDRKYTGCNLKTTKLLDCALIGICVVIRMNTVCTKWHKAIKSLGFARSGSDDLHDPHDKLNRRSFQ